MSDEPRSDRQYLGQFGVAKVYPKTMFKRGKDGGAMVEAKTVSLLLPLAEALKLAEAIQRAAALKEGGQSGPETIEIKVNRREERRGKTSGLFSSTVTWVE